MSQKESMERPKEANLGSIEVYLTPDMVCKWVESMGDDNPWHAQDSPFGGPIIPAALLFGLAIKLRYNAGILSWPEGDDAVQIQYDMETYRPIRVGERLRVTGRLVDSYVKRKREYFEWDIRFTDESGEEVARYHHTDLETYRKVGDR